MHRESAAGSALKQLVKRAVSATGYELKRLHPAHNPSFQLVTVLKVLGIDLVLDVGANTGRFASELRSAGYAERLVSFEPLSEAHRVLAAAAQRDGKWHVHVRCALGDHDGEVEINIAGNSVSSSVLRMLEAHASASVGSAYTGVERVPMRRLDSIAPQYLDSSKRPFLKLDTQGSEWQVLDGASETLARVQGVVSELSLVPLYEGQYMWRDVIDRLEAAGFTLWSILRGFTDGRNGRTLQVNGIFVRE